MCKDDTPILEMKACIREIPPICKGSGASKIDNFKNEGALEM